MTIDEYRTKIKFLDNQINECKDKEEKLRLIDENIQLNREYIHVLRKPIPVKIVFCVILSIFFLLGLMIFLPQINIRKGRIRICLRRIDYLEQLKTSLQE